MPRLATLLAALLLTFPAAAFAQGAGDDQYQDPFGDQQSQSGSGSGSGGGSSKQGSLSDSPQVGGGSSSSGSSGSSGSGSSGSSGSGTAGTSAPTTTPQPATGAQATDQLPRTGSDPRMLLLVGATMILTGVGLRLRTIDPDAY